ncbi:MAG: isoprenylcysteine carboxyl methyltransferase, partial [Chloroflexi bacterium]|nr:isoprenylcysteine carboxyl methyltransferase [Chloroflexota bacterium]
MKALLGTLVFTILVPGAFVIGLPIMLGISSSTPGFVGSRTAGLLLILAGVAIYVWAATAFVREGKGTPSPTAPPTQFVAVGPYRYVRNPIYIGELIVVAGLAAILGSALVLIYAGGLFAVLHMF